MKKCLLIIGILSLQFSAAAAQDISAELARARSLYYDADFQASIDLLLSLEKQVGTDERQRVALYLGLSYLGLNQTELAKEKFVEVCTADDQYMPSAKEFSPKVINLFTEAKAVCAQNFCGGACDQVEELIAKGDFNSAESLLSTRSTCPCAANTRANLVNARYRKAQELYDAGRFAEATNEFAEVVALDGTHRLASEYVKLSQQRLELGVQQAFTDWRASFQDREYGKAADAYDRIKSSNVGPAGNQLVVQIEKEYQRVLSGIVESWRTACANGDMARMDALRKEALNTAPQSHLNSNALAEMAQCTQKACMPSDPLLAINRLTTRVNPLIEPSLQRYVTRGIRVAIEIGVDGTVTVKQVTNANARVAEALKSAVEQWRFYPAIVDNQPRCVDTELPITLIQP